MAAINKAIQIKEISGIMSVHLVDALHEVGICERFEFYNADGRYLADGTHPNDAGKEQMGKYFVQQIETKYYI